MVCGCGDPGEEYSPGLFPWESDVGVLAAFSALALRSPERKQIRAAAEVERQTELGEGSASFLEAFALDRNCIASELAPPS